MIHNKYSVNVNRLEEIGGRVDNLVDAIYSKNL